MDDILDDLLRIAQKCERAALGDEKTSTIRKGLLAACASVGQAWSGSWLGYQASVYIEGFRAGGADDFFDIEWGVEDSMLNRTTGHWSAYDYDTVYQAILKTAHGSDPDVLKKASEEARGVFDECKGELLPVLDALLASGEEEVLRDLREQAATLKSFRSRLEFVQLQRPAQVASRDSRALQGGIQVPHHISFQAWVLQSRSCFQQVKALGGMAEHALRYLTTKQKLKGKTVAKKDGPVFIGHGHSPVWKDLRDFLERRLHLLCEEFDSEPVAGRTTIERLQEMLDKCTFAFLLMTGEDEHADGSQHARENVIHEIGLFQGRYTFGRAIILLEEGCKEFSNIAGLGEIRFPKGDIMAVSDAIRRVLEREKLLS